MSAATNTTDNGVRTSRNSYQPQSRVHRSRTRSGCERCRGQHRKCDETKPRCTRCINAGTQCQYIAHLSFLEKNSRTVSSDAVLNNKPTQSKAAYPAIEFVGSNEYPSLPQRSEVKTNVKERNQGDFNQEGKHSQAASSETRVLEHDLQSVGPQDTAAPSLNESWPLEGISTLSEHDFYLVRHFSHHVAPWLDVYDLNRIFGLLAPRLAMSSPWVMDAVLQLSAKSSGLETGKSGLRGFGAPYLFTLSHQQDEDSPLSALRMLLNFVLLKAKQFVEGVPDAWVSPFQGNGVPPGLTRNDFAEVAHRPLWLSSFALMSRFELAYSLMNEIAPAVSSAVLHEILVPLRTDSGSHIAFDGTFHACLHCLALLSDVTRLCLPAAEKKGTDSGLAQSTAKDTPSPEKWSALSRELRKWYATRPIDIQALVETDGAESVFPRALFTSDAGMWVNVIYHTAMLLLSDHRPHELLLNERNNSTEANRNQLSSCWHARRICGIAVNSDPEHTKCWDPCLIAAFYYASRRMSSPPQRHEIHACLEKIRTAGWHIGKLIVRLRTYWADTNKP